MVQIRHERLSDAPSIELLLDRAFGADRRCKASYRYRDGVEAQSGLSMVALAADGRLIGTIRYWPVMLGENGEALLLGPLAIHPEMHRRGIGRALVFTSLDLAAERGHRIIMLVGDARYYARFGFAVAPAHVIMPGENPARLLFRTLDDGVLPSAPSILQPRRSVRRAALSAPAAAAQPAAA